MRELVNGELATAGIEAPLPSPFDQIDLLRASETAGRRHSDQITARIRIVYPRCRLGGGKLGAVRRSRIDSLQRNPPDLAVAQSVRRIVR